MEEITNNAGAIVPATPTSATLPALPDIDFGALSAQIPTLCRNAELDFISCYWNSSVANYYIGPQNASVYGEGCYFLEFRLDGVNTSLELVGDKLVQLGHALLSVLFQGLQLQGVVVTGEHLLLVEADVEAFQRSQGWDLG